MARSLSRSSALRGLSLGLAIGFSTILLAQTHCRVRYAYNQTGDRIQRYWYCWVPGQGEEGEPPPEEGGEKSRYRLADVQLNIMPNPASNELIVLVPDGITTGTMEMISSTGNTVGTIRVSGPRTMFDVSAVPAGHYFIRFLQGNESVIAACVITH